MNERLLIAEPHSHFSREKKYVVSPDLTTTQPYIIPPWSERGPGIQTIDLSLSNDSVFQYDHVTLRSRMAQAGLDSTAPTVLSDNMLRVVLRNFSPNEILLAENLGVSYLYKPSRPAQGYELIQAVAEHIDVDYGAIIFADIEGNVWHPDSIFNALHDIPHSLIYLGIQINTETLYEVKPTQGPIEVGKITDVREDATTKFRSVTSETITPFGVTTTVPIAVNGTYLTVVEDLYGNLRHLPSLVIHPNRSQWNTTDANNAGIRLEYYSQDNKPFTSQQLPPYAFVTVHPYEQ